MTCKKDLAAKKKGDVQKDYLVYYKVHKKL